MSKFELGWWLSEIKTHWILHLVSIHFTVCKLQFNNNSNKPQELTLTSVAKHTTAVQMCFALSIWHKLWPEWGFPGGSVGEESSCSAGDASGEFRPWAAKIPWRRKRQPTPARLPGEPHGQGSLAGCSPRGHRVGHDRVTEHARTHWQEWVMRLVFHENHYN